METNEKTVLAQELLNTIGQFKRISGPPGSSKGIRPSEFMLLSTLTHGYNSDFRGKKVSELSSKMGITPAGVTHMINSLEEGGFVERLADPADRRVVLVKPTDKAIEVFESMKAEFLETLKGLVEFLGENDSKEFIRLLSSTLSYIRDTKERQKSDADKS